MRNFVSIDSENIGVSLAIRNQNLQREKRKSEGIGTSLSTSIAAIIK